MSYWRFAAMIATSTVVMFILMYLNTYLVTHVFWSETRVYMAILMGATMAIVMLGFMWSMYSRKTLNAVILAGAVIVIGGALWLVRSQATVGDTSFMRAMIPHHSIAIMTSSRSSLSDPRVQKLASEIVYAQDKEIAEMRYLVRDIDANGDAPGPRETGPAGIVSLQEALSTAEIPVLDPGFMTAEDLAQAFPDGAACTFTFIKGSPPVLAVAAQGDGAAGLVKISGDLVLLDVADAAALGSGPRLTADGLVLRISVPGEDAPLEARDGPRPADLVLDLDAGLHAGYRGFYQCRG